MVRVITKQPYGKFDEKARTIIFLFQLNRRIGLAAIKKLRKKQ